MHSKFPFLALPLAAACLAAPNVFAEQAIVETETSDIAQAITSLNPAIGAVVDVYYQQDDSEEGLSHVKEEMAGFGHAHGEGEEAHAHDHGPEEGFNLRHVELQFSAAVDSYFKAQAIAAIGEDDTELEVGEIETTGLPGGLVLRGGKFFSDFSIINAQHAHQWDFTDQPLIYDLTLGDHGLNDVGAQVSWLVPTPFYLHAGAEAFQGDNEASFNYDGTGPLPTHAGPRVGVGWLKVGPTMPGNHALQAGLSAGQGRHQEEHAEEAGEEFFDGDTTFWSAEAVYRYDAQKEHGQGDVRVQAEYFSRERDLDLVAADAEPALVGGAKVDEQDGYYVQAVYGLLPRWRAGMRWEQVGLTNESREPDGTAEDFGTSDRATVMVDFTPSGFSRIRLQASNGSYVTEAGKEDVTEVYVQWLVSIGSHGAHRRGAPGGDDASHDHDHDHGSGGACGCGE